MQRYEIPLVLREIKKEMPILTENYFKVPNYSFSLGMPKNMSKVLAFRYEKFLDNNQHLLDEILSKQKNPALAAYLYNQNLSFRKCTHQRNPFFDKLADLARKFILQHQSNNVLCCGFFFQNQRTVFSKVLGTEIETDGSSSGSPNFGANHLEGAASTSFINGAYYDYIKWDLSAGAAGNCIVALYEDTGSAPVASLSQSGEQTAVANYTTQYPITEVKVNATKAWIAHQQNNNNSKWSYWNSVTTRYYRAGFAYANPLPDPWGSSVNDTNNAPRMKTGHT